MNEWEETAKRSHLTTLLLYIWAYLLSWVIFVFWTQNVMYDQLGTGET